MHPSDPFLTGRDQTIQLSMWLCVEAETTLLDRVTIDGLGEMVDAVLSRYGIPEAVLRDESVPGYPPVGWIVPAPVAPAIRPEQVVTPAGAVTTPAPHVEIRAAIAGITSHARPALPVLADSPPLAEELASHGLLDAADTSIPQLWRQYRAAASSEAAPASQLDTLLSVHARARSAGAVQLAAHAADNVGHLLHRTGDASTAAVFHRWALGVYSRARLPVDRAVALTNLAHALWHDARHEAAVEAGLRAVGIARRTHRASTIRRAAMITAYPLVDAGRAGDALELLAGVRPQPAADPLEAGWWHHAHGTALLAVGSPAVASDAADEALRSALRAEDAAAGDLLAVEAHLLRAAVADARSDPGGAASARHQAEAARAALPEPFTH